MRILAAVLAALLVAGAAAMFVRAQIVKNAPSPIVAPTIGNRVFSPDAFKPRRREATLTVGLRQRTPAQVVVLDQDDVEVAIAETSQRGRRITARWDGRRADGRLAADGAYRFAIRLPAQERTIRIPDPIRLDATPPVVESDAKPGRYISPGLEGEAGVYRFTLRASEPVRFRLDVRQIQPSGAARLIRREALPRWSRAKEMRWAADAGNLPIDAVGEFVAPGSYIVGWKAEDRGGNIVMAPATVEPGQLAPARVVGVRTVQLTPRLEPLTLLADVELIRHRPDAAFPGSTVARAKGAPGAVRLPRARAGFYAVEIAGNGWQGWAPEAVPGRAPAAILVPLYTWQAANPADADLSGFPDVPPAPLDLDRPLPLEATNAMASLGRTVVGLRRGLGTGVGAVTDAAVERGGVPRGVRVLAVAGATVWTPGLRARLAAFQRRGGTLLVLGDEAFTRAATRSGNGITLGRRTGPALDALDPVRTVEEARVALDAPAPS